jgi:putative exosortase-associated protein (TIGR04073 family)
VKSGGNAKHQGTAMMKRFVRKAAYTAAVALMTAGFTGTAQAQDGSAARNTFYYFPNRVLDLVDIVSFGIAFGPGYGAEVAFTQNNQFGFYETNETGWAWYGSNGNRRLHSHSGYYKTKVEGTERYETVIDDSVRFRRGELEKNEYDLRAQVALLLVHPYIGIDWYEVGDFFTGLVGKDLSQDDMNPITYRDGEPGRKLGRGITNLGLCWWEIPRNIYQVKNEHGSVAGVTWGTIRGCARTIVRAGTGVYEVTTFANGRQRIIEPEFIFHPEASDTTWRYRTE